MVRLLKQIKSKLTFMCVTASFLIERRFSSIIRLKRNFIRVQSSNNKVHLHNLKRLMTGRHKSFPLYGIKINVSTGVYCAEKGLPVKSVVERGSGGLDSDGLVTWLSLVPSRTSNVLN